MTVSQTTQIREIRWSRHNLSRLLRLTGETPARIEVMRTIFDALGMNSGCGRHWIGRGGVFDHGVFLGRAGKPYAVRGHPYGISADEHALLSALAAFPALRVAIDDQPSEYGFTTNRVWIELPEPRTPYVVPRSTYKTRRARRLVRAAFRAEGLATI